LVALREFGCDLGQGFLFSRAVPDGDLHEVVAELAKAALTLGSRLPRAR
jgi:EAL domain-containing protein (putative c-di-GMP-specific phosphodiesterase class I)